MTLPWALFEICINAIQCGLALYFGIRVFDPKPHIRIEGVYVIPAWIIATILTSAFTFIPLPREIDILPCVVAFLVLTCVFYEGHLLYKAACCAVYFVGCAIITLLMQVLTLRLFSVPSAELFKPSTARLLHILAICAIQIPATLLAIRIARAVQKKRMIPHSSYGIYVVFVALPFTSLFVLLILLNIVTAVPEQLLPSLNIDIAAVALLFVNLLVLWIFDHVNKQNENVLMLESEKQRMAFQLQHYQDIEAIYKDMQQWEHDKKKHMQTMLALVEMRQYEKMSSYLGELVEHYGSLTTSYKTGNLTTDALLSAMGAMLNQDHIQFKVNLALPEKLCITDNDLTIIIGNLLENAREACMKVDDLARRKIRLVGQVCEMTLQMQIINSHKPCEEQRSLRSLTGSVREKHQGIGLSIVEKRLNEYSGYIAYVEDNDIFRVDLMIPLQ